MLSFITGLLGNKYVAYALAVLAVLAGLWGYGHHRYNQGVDDTRTADKIAAAAQYQANVAQANAAVADLQAKLTELQNASPKIITQYKRIVVKAPLPTTCHIDPDRLRNIQSAIDAGNATR